MGFPLAKRLTAQGYTVSGSTTQISKLVLLRNSDINPFLITCSPHIEGEQVDHFFHSQVLILTLPFKRNMIDPNYYRDQIQSIVSKVNQSNIKFVIFSSSTAIYRSDTEIASESDYFEPDNLRSKVLLEVEHLLMENKNFQSTIIRFAGLYGDERELYRFLKGPKAKQRDGQSPVNLIHQDDCIEIIYKIICNNIRGEIFNAVSDVHPTRKELYTRKALELGLEAPVFEQNEKESRKIVSNKKVKEMLNYQFIHPDPSE